MTRYEKRDLKNKREPIWLAVYFRFILLSLVTVFRTVKLSSFFQTKFTVEVTLLGNMFVCCLYPLCLRIFNRYYILTVLYGWLLFFSVWFKVTSGVNPFRADCVMANYVILNVIRPLGFDHFCMRPMKMSTVTNDDVNLCPCSRYHIG